MTYFVEVHSDLGAGKHGTDKGVEQLASFAKKHYAHAQFDQLIIDHKDNIKSNGTAFSHLKYAEYLLPFYQKVAKHIEKVASMTTPIIISGDHSGAIGLLSGFKNAHLNKKIAVVWIDAHADLHSVYTTPSGNLHGMPIGAVIGIDNKDCSYTTPTDTEKQLWQAFKDLSKTDNLALSDVYFLGLRSFEAPEIHLIERYNLFAKSAQVHRQQGFDDVLDDLCRQLVSYDVIYVSFDVDALDESLIGATGTREPNGYMIHEIERIFDKLLSLPNIGAFEITEFNPTLDDDSHKHQAIYQLFDYAIGRLSVR